MEHFSMQILHNDVEHLEKNMKTVFQQLRILQEFVKLEFGSKFHEFYAYQISQDENPSGNGTRAAFEQSAGAGAPNYNSGTVGGSVTLNLVPGRAFIPPVANDSETTDSISRMLETEENPIIIKPEFFELQYSDDDGNGGDGSISNNDHGDEFYGENRLDISGEEKNYDSDYTPKKATNSQRRKRHPQVTRFFKFNYKIPNSKAQCLKCGSFVSNRLSRLKGHMLQKCIEVQQGRVAKAGNTDPIGGYRMESATTSINLMSMEDHVGSIMCEQSITSKKSSVRKFFVPCTVDGIIKSKCLRCGKPVSNKVERMRNHYSQCVKTVTDSSGGLDDDFEIDDSFDNPVTRDSSVSAQTEQKDSSRVETLSNQGENAKPSFMHVVVENNSSSFSNYPS